MNREPDLDQTLRDWLDEGSDHAPERFIWAALDDVERSAQRGAWRVSLEERFVNMKPAALVLVTTAVIIGAIATYQLVVGPNIGNPGPSPSPSQAARLLTSEDLPDIVLTDANAPAGFTVDTTESGVLALLTPFHPGGTFIDQSAFVDALMTNLNSTETGGYVSWSALFETAVDAEAAFDYVANEHGPAGWGMARSSVDPALGDESASYTGAAYDLFRTNLVYLWRVNNVLLAAVAVGDVSVGEANADQLFAIAELMDDRAH
ncbi:MAG TPA: hypothetical protein VJ839_07485 [Candidatus Limnocylindria bacterium]|nr:hypothetical protein [Candidatus Limnocylindria bacterium]